MAAQPALPVGFALLATKAADNQRASEWCGTATGPGGLVLHLKLGVSFAKKAFDCALKPETSFHTLADPSGFYLPFNNACAPDYDMTGSNPYLQAIGAGFLMAAPPPEFELPPRSLSRDGAASETRHIAATIQTAAPIPPELFAHLLAMPAAVLPAGESREAAMLQLRLQLLAPRRAGHVAEQLWRTALLPSIALEAAARAAGEATYVQNSELATDSTPSAVAVDLMAAAVMSGVRATPIPAGDAGLATDAEATSLQAEAAAVTADAFVDVAASAAPDHEDWKLPPVYPPHVRPGQRTKPPPELTNRDAHVKPHLRAWAVVDEDGVEVSDPKLGGVEDDPEEHKQVTFSLQWDCGDVNNERILNWQGVFYVTEKEKAAIESGEVPIVHITAVFVGVRIRCLVAVPSRELRGRVILDSERRGGTEYKVQIRSRMLFDQNGVAYGGGKRFTATLPTPRETRGLVMQLLKRLRWEWGWALLQELVP